MMGPMLRFQRIYGLKNTYSVVTTAISRGTIHQKSTCDFNQSSSRGFHGYCGSENFCQSGFRSGSCRGITTSAVVRNKKVFDRKAKLMQKERAALLDDVDSYDYIKSQIGQSVADRLLEINRECDEVLNLGCGLGQVARHIPEKIVRKKLTMSDFSPTTLAHSYTPVWPGVEVEKMVLDEDAPLPFPDNKFNLVVSNLSLHWVNDLPGCFREVHRTLAPDGAFVASLFGGDTLYELRSSLLLAEMEREGGISAHVSPFAKSNDLEALLSNAGFTLVILDSEEIEVRYPSLFEVVGDLRGMGESCANLNRKLRVQKDTLCAAAAIYQEMYGDEDSVPATFEILHMIGWKEDPKNPRKKVKRGSGEMTVKDLARLQELIAEKGVEGRIQFMDEIADKDK